MDASYVYVRALALCCFYSQISTRIFLRALTASLDSCAEIECPFSGVTKSGRVWSKVPESGARSVVTAFTKRHKWCGRMCSSLCGYTVGGGRQTPEAKSRGNGLRPVDCWSAKSVVRGRFVDGAGWGTFLKSALALVQTRLFLSGPKATVCSNLRSHVHLYKRSVKAQWLAPSSPTSIPPSPILPVPNKPYGLSTMFTSVAGCTDIHSGSIQSWKLGGKVFHFQGLESPSEMNNSAGVGNSLTSHVILKSQTFAGFENNSLDTCMYTNREKAILWHRSELWLTSVGG